MYVVLAGLPGTGKSILAAALAQRLKALHLNAVVLSKDDVRAALFPGDAADYSEQQNDISMEAILAAAGYLRNKSALQPNDPPLFLLFDGRTFARAAQIEPVITAAEASGSAWRILHLVCPDEIARERLDASAKTHPAANRSFALFLDLQKRFESISRPHLVLDTSRPLEESVEASRAYLEPAIQMRRT